MKPISSMQFYSQLFAMTKNFLYFFIEESKGMLQFFVVYYPRTNIGSLIRKIYWKNLLNIGDNFKLDRGTLVENPKLIKIGNNFLTGTYVEISAGNCNGIYIGNNVWISKNSFLRSANHNFDSLEIPLIKQGHKCASIEFENRIYSIIIEDDCWIASNCTILSGAHIGKGSIISSNTVVSSKIPPYSIVIGNPCRVVGNRTKLSKAQTE